MNVKEKLLEYAEKHPKLVYQNEGYDEMPAIDKEMLKAQIGEIESLLNPLVWGFVRFQNFKRRENGGLVIRCQVYYNDEKSFIGVSYIELDAFQTFELKES